MQETRASVEALEDKTYQTDSLGMLEVLAYVIDRISCEVRLYHALVTINSEFFCLIFLYIFINLCDQLTSCTNAIDRLHANALVVEMHT